jgi:hypothetical protein
MLLQLRQRISKNEFVFTTGRASLLSLVVFLVSSGCAARFETASGNSWIVGFSRVSTEVHEIGPGRFAMMKSEQQAPLEVGLVTYGLTAGLGLNGAATAFVGPRSSTNAFRPAKTFGIPLGGGDMPWRWGLTRYKTSLKEATTSVRINTVRGLDFKLRSEDPAIRLGYSRATFTKGESTNGVTRIIFITDRIAPRIGISEEPND